MNKYKLLALTSALHLSMTPAVMAEPIKVGFVTTLTTSSGAIGQDMRDAVELALDHIDHKMAGTDVEVIYEDDGFKPEIGKQKTDKLVKKDKVDFISGYIWSHVLMASYKSAVDNDVFVIGANAGPGPIAGKLCHENFFSTSWQNDQNSMAIGEVLNEHEVKRLYIMAPNYTAGKNMVSGLKETYKGEIIGQDMTKFPSQLDFSTELAKIKAAKPDAVWVFYPGKHGVQFLKQYKQAGLDKTVPLYNVFTVDNLNLPKIGQWAEDSLMTQFWAPDMDTPANKKFVGGFKEKYNRYPSFYAAQSYDALMLIDSAVRKVEGNLTNKDAVRAALKEADFESVRGELNFGNNHFPVQDFYLVKVKQDQDGAYTTMLSEKILAKHQDNYAVQCQM
ncbi:ABC transporter substrate-binding protein [Vibrio coralliilyticus]|uniref:ABC transporter substrate-binding protein n=1 Tax=Vibrio coralliilyticus TaxID=190893 RepID=A0A837GC44_9VIBR|nr:ABC transporter substrate-binding protein [Vibrio coralliilyticus]KJY70956.1 ABC transporter substrate-binding protein [Vibrio coralliilyticus]